MADSAATSFKPSELFGSTYSCSQRESVIDLIWTGLTGFTRNLKTTIGESLSKERALTYLVNLVHPVRIRSSGRMVSRLVSGITLTKLMMLPCYSTRPGGGPPVMLV